MGYYTVRTAQKYLSKHGVKWTEQWIRMQISAGTMKSVKMLNTRAIPKEEIERIIKEKKNEK